MLAFPIIAPQICSLRSHLTTQTSKLTRSSITNISRVSRQPVWSDSNCNRFLQSNKLRFQNDLKSYPTTRPSIPRQSFSRTKTSVGILLAITGYQLTKPAIQLDAALPPPTFDNLPHQPIELEPEEFSSLLSVRKLSFGTLTGICAGVFVKKGLNFLAFLFGGGFVLLQYLHSSSLIKINWKTWANRYESKFWSAKEPPTKSIVARFLDFLTSDFQYRSTFTVGFFLGLRIG
ncbi:hypothetical protein PGTUg99_013469 [Puccinia graminis f. sp. tritici]|uniref:FUN14 domain-containing protein 1 n=1 Tax=Puccinia graminis f. sp. tritici TaxID=56615 RepID=A0A5B0SB43_PUCGR|nr:hypothetical protein PGTUg99_013469 [Puccinia graminis f. sp. tritici]